MGCCCGAIAQDRDSRSTSRDIDLEGQHKSISLTHEPKTDDDDTGDIGDMQLDDQKAGRPSHETERNIVTETLGHLVGPDSARQSLQAIRVSQDSFRTLFACLQLHANDRLILLNFPPGGVQLVRNIVQARWPRGIQSEESDSSSTTTTTSLKLKGNPWLAHGEESLIARRMVKSLVEGLYDAGWVLNLASSIASLGHHEKDSLIFRHQDPAPARCDWMAISFVQQQFGPLVNTVQLVDAPPDVVQVMATALAPLTKRHSELTGEKVYEFELKENPFQPSWGKKASLAQDLMLALLPGLEKCGFTVSATIDHGDAGHKPDTWYCCRTVGWTPGLPVFHR